MYGISIEHCDFLLLMAHFRNLNYPGVAAKFPLLRVHAGNATLRWRGLAGRLLVNSPDTSG